MTQNIPDELLTIAEKPSRYVGTEVNSICKDKADVRFLLAFPDTYEVGIQALPPKDVLLPGRTGNDSFAIITFP